MTEAQTSPDTTPKSTAAENVEAAGERSPHTNPRGYFASLADYNAGRLVGMWIDDLTDAEAVQDQIQTMLYEHAEPGAEEWALHDYEGFGTWRPSEYESLDTLALVAAGIVAHGPAFAAWADYLGDLDDERIAAFDDHYRGHWNNIEEFATEMIADHGFNLGKHVPQWIRPYVRIDYDMLSRDLSMDLHATPAEGGGLWIFEPDA